MLYLVLFGAEHWLIKGDSKLLKWSRRHLRHPNTTQLVVYCVSDPCQHRMGLNPIPCVAKAKLRYH